MAKAKSQNNIRLFTHEQESILEAVSDAVNHHTISSQEIANGILLLAQLADIGIAPRDLRNKFAPLLDKHDER